MAIVNAIPLLIPGCGYKVEYSARFRATASAKLSRTYGSYATWGLGVWVRRCRLGAVSPVLGSVVRFNVDDTLTAGTLTTTAKFRDTGGWYHLAIAAGRLYVNGTDMGATTTSALTNTAIGTDGTNYFDGVMADFVLFDGTCPAVGTYGSFQGGGVWTPNSPSLAAETVLTFANPGGMGFNPGIGADWTPSGVLSTDQSDDTPTNLFCALDALDGNYPGQTPRDGGLRYQWTSPNQYPVFGTLSVKTGKWYWEFIDVAGAISAPVHGVYPISNGLNRNTYYAQYAAGCNSVVFRAATGNININGSGWTPFAGPWAIGQVMGFALNLDSSPQTITIYRSNVTQGTANLPVSGQEWAPVFGQSGDYSTVEVNFGQLPFTYAPPAGFNPLCTAMLPGVTTTSGTFWGNASTDGPRVRCGATPTALSINGNAVVWGAHADKLADGFKIRTASASYNASGANTWNVNTGAKLVTGECRIPNNAQAN